MKPILKTLTTVTLVIFSVVSFQARAGGAYQGTTIMRIAAAPPVTYINVTATPINPANCTDPNHYALTRDLENYEEVFTLVTIAQNTGQPVLIRVLDDECYANYYPKIDYIRLQ